MVSTENIGAVEMYEFINSTVLGRNATIITMLVTNRDRGEWYSGVVTGCHLTSITGGQKCVINIVVNGRSVILHHDEGKYADIKFAFIDCN